MALELVKEASLVISLFGAVEGSHGRGSHRMLSSSQKGASAVHQHSHVDQHVVCNHCFVGPDYNFDVGVFILAADECSCWPSPDEINLTNVWFQSLVPAAFFNVGLQDLHVQGSRTN